MRRSSITDDTNLIIILVLAIVVCLYLAVKDNAKPVPERQVITVCLEGCDFDNLPDAEVHARPGALIHISRDVWDGRWENPKDGQTLHLMAPTPVPTVAR